MYGNSIKKTDPLPDSDSNQILPPAFSTYLLTIDNPRPVPDDLVVKFGVNIFFCSESGIPVPLSETVTITFFFAPLEADFYYAFLAGRY